MMSSCLGGSIDDIPAKSTPHTGCDQHIRVLGNTLELTIGPCSSSVQLPTCAVDLAMVEAAVLKALVAGNPKVIALLNSLVKAAIEGHVVAPPNPTPTDPTPPPPVPVPINCGMASHNRPPGPPRGW